MRLRKFRARAYRCIHDSGEIRVGDLAAFVGRNESGKTTILQALTLLNKDQPVSELDLCDEMTEDLKQEVRLAEGEFDLNHNEIRLIKETFPSIPEIKKLRFLELTKIQYRSMILEMLKLARLKIVDLTHGKILEKNFFLFWILYQIMYRLN